jgi:hypothetical protein
VNHEANKPAQHLPKRANNLRAEDLWEIETYLRDKGASTFLYDEDLDGFRFEEDARFAFCDEFANWELLGERGYLDL